jgi:hypothetical protein
MADTIEVKSEKGSIWIFKRALQDNVNYESLTPTNQFVDKKEQEIIKNLWMNYVDSNGKQKTRQWATWLNIRFDKKYHELEKIFDSQSKEGYNFVSVPLDWQKSFFAQQQAMLSKFSGSNFKIMEFGRDKEHFMEFISKLVKPLGVTKKDTWNPADIWIVDKNKVSNIEKSLTDVVEFKKNENPSDEKQKIIKLQELNKILRTLYANKIIIGVSLKLTKEKADYIDVNVVLNGSGLDDAGTQKRFKEIEDMLCELKLIKCDLSLLPFSKIYTTTKSYDDKVKKMKALLKSSNYPEDPKSFGTQETSLEIKENDYKSYSLTIKATQTSEYSNLKYEPTEKGKSSAKLGKAGVNQVDELFKSYGLSFQNDNKKYPKVYSVQVDKIVQQFASRKNSAGIPFITNETSAQKFLSNIKEVYKSDPVTAQSKLMQLDLFSEILGLKENQVRKLMTDIVYIAKKEGKAYGPFGKVY